MTDEAGSTRVKIEIPTGRAARNTSPFTLDQGMITTATMVGAAVGTTVEEAAVVEDTIEVPQITGLMGTTTEEGIMETDTVIRGMMIGAAITKTTDITMGDGGIAVAATTVMATMMTVTDTDGARFRHETIVTTTTGIEVGMITTDETVEATVGRRPQIEIDAEDDLTVVKTGIRGDTVDVKVTTAMLTATMSTRDRGPVALRTGTDLRNGKRDTTRMVKEGDRQMP